jgi:hypothetical protein
MLISRLAHSGLFVLGANATSPREVYCVIFPPSATFTRDTEYMVLAQSMRAPLTDEIANYKNRQWFLPRGISSRAGHPKRSPYQASAVEEFSTSLL